MSGHTLLIFAAVALLALPASAQEPEKKPPVPTPEQLLAGIEKHASKHPEDVVGIRDRYLDVRAKFPVDSDTYRTVTKRVGALDETVGKTYRAVRPTAGEAKLSDTQKTRAALTIARDLKKREPLVRLRAAEYLERLECDSGSTGLVRQLKREKVDEVRGAIVSALIAIGGPLTGELIQYKMRGANRTAQMASLDVLESLIAPSNDAEDKRASFALGEFVYANDPDVVERAIAILMKAKNLGVWGLMKACGIGDHQLKLRVIRALGETGEGRAAVSLVRYLDIGAKDLQAEYKKAAAESIRRIGLPCVPWLIRYFEDPNCRQWTKRVLYDITGQSFERPEEVKAWWGRHERKKARKRTPAE